MVSISTPTINFQKTGSYWAACVTHFFIDFLNNGRSILMALLAVSLGMSNAQVGLLLVIYNVGNALSQPLFGWLTDRIGPKKLVVGGMLWMVIFSALTAVLPAWGAVVTLTAAGLGSGMFHPAGTTIATRPDFARRNLATGLFFFFGSAGLFVGPIVAGALLDSYGRIGYMIAAGIAASAFAFGLVAINDEWFHQHLAQEKQADQPEKVNSRTKLGWLFLPVLLMIIGYSSVSNIVMTYLPKHLIENGISVSYAGWVTGAYLFGTMLGVLSGGLLADRLNNKIILFVGMAGPITFTWFGVPAVGNLQLLLLFIGGLLAALPHSILVLLIQSFFPKGRGFASGLALGGMFFMGSIFSYLAGIMADIIGLELMLQGAGALPLIAAVMLIFVPAAFIQQSRS